MESVSNHAVKQLLDVVETGRVLGKAPRTIRDLAKRGVLQAIRIDGTRGLRFRPESLQRLIEQNETTSGR